jgi:hypothetical protein
VHDHQGHGLEGAAAGGASHHAGNEHAAAEVVELSRNCVDTALALLGYSFLQLVPPDLDAQL